MDAAVRGYAGNIKECVWFVRHRCSGTPGRLDEGSTDEEIDEFRMMTDPVEAEIENFLTNPDDEESDDDIPSLA